MGCTDGQPLGFVRYKEIDLMANERVRELGGAMELGKGWGYYFWLCERIKNIRNANSIHEG